MSKIELHDFNCGLKSYKKEVIKNIEVSGEMHRYIPFLAKNAGFGIKGIKERIQKLHGEITIISTKQSRGTITTVRLPITASEQQS